MPIFLIIDCGVADILIIIDDSNGSEGFNNSNMMKTLAKEIIKDLNSMLFRFSVLRYSSSVSKMFGLIEFSRLPDVIPSIDRIRYFPGTSTDTDKALKYARVSIFNSKRADAANIIILLTDGLPNNLNKTKSESDLLRKQGVRIFSVGVGNETKTEGLSLIASSPSDEHVFQVSTLGDLSLIINAVQNKTCKGTDLKLDTIKHRHISCKVLSPLISYIPVYILLKKYYLQTK